MIDPQDNDIPESVSQIELVRRSRRLHVSEVFSGRRSGNIRIHVADPALRIDGIPRHLRQAQRNRPLVRRRMNIAGKIVEMQLALVVIGNNLRVAWDLDDVFQVKIQDAGLNLSIVMKPQISASACSDSGGSTSFSLATQT